MYFLRLGASWDRAVVPTYEDAASGKYVVLLKTLLTSHCKNECAYCTFRAGRQCPRTVWKHKKLAEFTVQLWRERKISGLFRSSSVSKDPDCVTKMQLDVLRVLRRNGYSGYIHLRIMSAASPYYIRGAVELADCVGVNLEAPNKDVFSELCPDKGGLKETVINA